MRIWVVFVLAIAPLHAQEPEEPVATSSSRLVKGPRPADAGAVEVRLLQGGALQVRKGEAWDDVTLNGLSVALVGEAERHHARQQKEGESGEFAGGVRVSRLFLSIRADPLVPWQHVQWLMTIAAESRFYRIELRVDGRAVQTFLPRDTGIRPVEQAPPNEIKAAVHVVSRKEKAIRWGDVEVHYPTAVKYRFGDRTSGRLDDVRRWLRDARKAAAAVENTVVVGELKAGHKVPVARIFEVIGIYADQGFEQLEFYGTQIPGAALRSSKRLPYPKSNYARAD